MNVALTRRRWRPKRQSGGLVALRFAAVGLAALLMTMLVSILLAAGVVASVYAVYVEGLPSAEEIGRRSVETFETTRIYDRTGKQVLYEIIPPEGGRRTIVPLARIPEHLRNATIAMEDKTFYTNPVGVNVRGLVRAAWGTVSGEYAGGGSSIPQQLIRYVIMTPEERMERSYERKIKEMILAYELTRRYPGIEGRDQILEWYLNNIFYGHFAYGIEAAAQTYFHKHVEELTLAESAMLVPLGNSPALNPIDAPEEAQKRQEIVLDNMYLQGYITAGQAWTAKQQPLLIAPPRFDIVAPHYVLYVRQLLEEKFGSDAVFGGGLQVISAIDLETQRKTEEVVREQLGQIREKYNANNAAVVVQDVKTAEIRAMVGSLNYFDRTIDGQVNMALAPRQPGSSFKPYVYATAFSHGYTPATMVMDVRTSFMDMQRQVPYVPENYSRNYNGPMLLRRALACSYNIPAVAMGAKVGTKSVVETARAMGITTLTEPNYGLSVCLGGSEVRLVDMTYAFSVLANGGVMLGEPAPAGRYMPGFRQLDPVAILKVTDPSGKVLYEYTQPQRQAVLRPEAAFLVTDILSDNNARAYAFGYDSILKLPNRPAAVKTGTTNSYHDAWTVGYTPQYVVGVWVGNSDYEEMKNLADGSRVAAPIWNPMMQWLHNGLPVEGFVRPAGLETAIVDSTSGKLPTKYSPQRMQELFIKGSVPTEYDDVHQPFQLCKQTGKLATPYCPPELVEEKVFEIYPPEADDWIREKGIPQAPREYCNAHGPNLAAADVAIISPTLLLPVRGVVPIIGNTKPGDLQKWWLQVGQGMTPKSWAPIGPEHDNRIENNVLEYWDTRSLEGLYTLQLSVLAGGNHQQASLQVLVDNISPTVTLLAPDPDPRPDPQKKRNQYTFKDDEWINIQVDAQDNTAMGRVEFYVDDKLLGHSTVAPFTMRWMIPPGHVGEHTVYVMAYDAAGNVVKTEPVKAYVVLEKTKE